MSYIPVQLRQQIELLAKGCCEYCQTQRMIVMYLEVDHIVPLRAGGKTVLENLCLTCRVCNSFKQGFQSGIDAETGEESTLYNPRTQVWAEHFRWDENKTRLIGLTSTGRATINRLKINSDEAIQTRETWVLAGWHPPKDE